MKDCAPNQWHQAINDPRAAGVTGVLQSGEAWSSNGPPPRTDAEALEIRLLSVIHTEVGELRSRVHRLEGVVAVAVREAVAPLTRDVAKLLDAVQALSRGRVDVPSVRS